jgi:hypothetical protein
VNAEFEFYVPQEFEKPRHDEDRVYRQQYIEAKYQKRQFMKENAPLNASGQPTHRPPRPRRLLNKTNSEQGEKPPNLNRTMSQVREIFLFVIVANINNCFSFNLSANDILFGCPLKYIWVSFKYIWL